MAPFLRLSRAAPAARQDLPANARVLSDEAARACGHPVLHFTPPRAKSERRVRKPQWRLIRYFMAASYILATYSQLTR